MDFGSKKRVIYLVVLRFLMFSKKNDTKVMFSKKKGVKRGYDNFHSIKRRIFML
eukprot:UN02135